MSPYNPAFLLQELLWSPLKSLSDPVECMNTLGTCLTSLMSLEDIKVYQQPDRVLLRNTNISSIGFRLHSARHCSYSNLIALIINLKDGVPQSYDILRCGPQITRYDLIKFFRRAKLPSRQHKPSFVLEVNKLTYSVQEVNVT